MDQINKKIMMMIFLLSLLGNSAYAGETVRLASGEWPPYQSEKLIKGGFVSHIIMEAFAAGGVEVKLGYFPWKRSFEMAKNGKWDGTFIWFDTKERREDFFISDPVVDVKYVFFHLNDYPFDWNSVEDLKDVNIGATLGYEFGGEEFKNAEKSGTIKVHRVYNDVQGLKNLFQGRIQVFPCDLLVGYELINYHFNPEQRKTFTHHEKPIKAAPHHLLLSKKITKNKRLISIFNQGLKKLKDTGKYGEYVISSREGKYKK